MEQTEVQNVEETKEVKTTENTETQTAEQKVKKTFTQEDFKKALDKEVARKTKDIPSKEDLKAFNEWKESQKTEAQKQSETLVENEKLKNRITELENMQVVANASVDSKFQKFVLSEVLQMEGEFEDNLTEYLKENIQYLQKTENEKTAEAPKTTGVAVTKINENAENGVKAILKAKRPELFKEGE